MQILFINILMDGAPLHSSLSPRWLTVRRAGPPSQSLGVDPVNRDVMKRAPRAKNAPVVTRRLLYRILFSASMIVLGTLFIYAHELGGTDSEDLRRDQTMVRRILAGSATIASSISAQTFTCFVFLDLVSAVQNRGLSCGLTQNRMLVLTCSTSFIAQLLLVYFPPLQAVFQTTALSLRDLGVLLSLGGMSALLHEARRRVERQQDAVTRWQDDAV
jgi:Ca2+-transporting ATPase